MHQLTDGNRHSLVLEIAYSFVWHILMSIRTEAQALEQWDITPQWENISQKVAANVAPQIKHITTIHQAENALEDVWVLVRDEFMRQHMPSETDKRLENYGSWDRWLEGYDNARIAEEEEQENSE